MMLERILLAILLAWAAAPSLVDAAANGTLKMEPFVETGLEYLSPRDCEASGEWRSYEAMCKKLRDTVISKTEFHDTPLREALAFLERETGVPMVDLTGVIPNPAASATDTQPLTLLLENKPAGEVLRYITALAGAACEIADSAVLLKPYFTSCGTLIEQDFPVKAPDTPERMAAWAAEEKKMFEQLGIVFLPGSSVRYDVAKRCLSVRNTEVGLDRIAEIWDFEVMKMSSIEEQKSLQDFRKLLAWRQALAKTTVHEAVFHDAPMEEVVQTLRLHVSPWVAAQGTSGIHLELSAQNTNLLDLLQKIADRSGTRLVLGSRAIVFIPAKTAK